MADWRDAEALRETDYDRAVPLTEEQLEKARISALAKGMIFATAPPTYTCDDCSRRFICKLVFDMYNTNGDCLWVK